jgi:hypothetical protein
MAEQQGRKSDGSDTGQDLTLIPKHGQHIQPLDIANRVRHAFRQLRLTSDLCQFTDPSAVSILAWSAVPIYIIQLTRKDANSPALTR